MVVFTCNHCGESLQKPKVEKHYSFTCRMEKFLTCVDCFKDFRDDYNVHIKCITEEERYSGKDFVQKPKKGEVKQESWMEMIKSIMLHESNFSQNYKNLLNTISYYNNVPRKKGKFINFIKSSTGGRTNIKDIEGIWDIIEKYKNEAKTCTEGKSDNTPKELEKTNNTIECEEQNSGINRKEDGNKQNILKSKEKKRKRDESNDKISENGNTFNEENGKKKLANCSNKAYEENNENKNSINNELTSFSFSEHILKILSQKECISKDKLYKKVLKKYIKYTGDSITEEILQKKVNKKLKKLRNIVVVDSNVKLIVE